MNIKPESLLIVNFKYFHPKKGLNAKLFIPFRVTLEYL